MGQAITTLFWRLLGRGEAGKSLLSADHHGHGDGDEGTGSVWLFGRYWKMGEFLISFLRWLMGRGPANPPSDPLSFYPFDYTPGPPDDDDVEYCMMRRSHFIDIGIDIPAGDQEEADSTGGGNFGSPVREVTIRLGDVDVPEAVIVKSLPPEATSPPPPMSSRQGQRSLGPHTSWVRLVDVEVAQADGVNPKSLPPAATSPPPAPAPAPAPISSRRGRGRLEPYSWEQKILLVGEGDFSFSTSLAVAFGDASNIIATSLDSFEFLMKNYERAVPNIFKLTSKGCKVMHGVDATKMANHPHFRYLKFDCIVYNFPHAGFANLKAPRHVQISKHQALVRGFLANAKKMINDEGQIHITHKSVGFSRKWNLEMLGTTEGLRLVDEAPFNYRDYPGYNTKYGYGGDRNFDCCHSKRYIFQLVTSQSPIPKKKRTTRTKQNN